MCDPNQTLYDLCGVNSVSLQQPLSVNCILATLDINYSF